MGVPASASPVVAALAALLLTASARASGPADPLSLFEAHEGPQKGHTIERHVSKSLEYLQSRLPKPKFASTFDNIEIAEDIVRKSVLNDIFEIARWSSVRGNRDKELQFQGDTRNPIGYGIGQADRRLMKLFGALVVLRQTRECGILIYTAYPAQQ